MVFAQNSMKLGNFLFLEESGTLFNKMTVNFDVRL